ncbi:hypothetical protein HDU82_008212 [Entophlyctis luteolus]|nr:hypothetical protein HDU82_008212 [Entophlyctis luteolus]
MTRRSLKRGHSCATADTQAALGLEKPVRKAAKGSDSLSFVNGDTERCGDSTASSTAVKLVRYYKDELIEYGVPPQRYLGRLLCPGEFIAVYTRPEDADHVPPSVVEILTKAKANLLEKLAQIQAQRQSLLQKQKEMIEGETTISASHKVQMGKDYIFNKVDASNCIRSPSTAVGDLDVVVPASPQASPKATRSKIKPQTTKSTALPDQTVSQRRLNSRSAMKNAGGEVAHSESPSVARKCHLNALTARELEKLTASNTAKNHGHVRVTLKMEIVRVNSARPPSPTADRDPTSFSDPNHPHRSLDATRHTKIQWREEASLAEEFGGPGVSTPINVQPGRCCLKKDKIRMSPRSTVFSEEVIVVKKFEYLDDAKPTQPQPQGIKGRRVVIGQRMAQRGASSNKASGGRQGRGK